MGRRTVAIVAAGLFFALTPPNASAETSDPDAVPPRTAISVRSGMGFHGSTANEHESRTALSLVKLYLADYTLRHGDGSDAERDLAERMIRYSDDGAASAVEAKYPDAIDTIAAEYHLTATDSGDSWGFAFTSTADVADFLIAKLRTDPRSPIFEWMAAAGATAADGTEQDWGTARLPYVLGTKWGWSDVGVPEVASASYGRGFVVVAHTHGTAEEQTADIMAALPYLADDLVPFP